MTRHPPRVYLAALLAAALGYLLARLVRGPHVGWGGPALIAWVTVACRGRPARPRPGAAPLGG